MTEQSKQITFSELFDGLIKESQSILIEYEHRNLYYKEDSFIDFNILSVNGCLAEYQFKKRIQKLIRDSLLKLNRHIQTIPSDEKIDFLDSIKDELDELTFIVKDDTQIFEESEYGPREEHHFKTFVKPVFKGTKDDKIKYYEKSISRKVENYAEMWLEVIGEAKQKVEDKIEALKAEVRIKFKDHYYSKRHHLQQLINGTG
jgi:hypothetical protein